MPISYTALATELANDPNSYGYAALLAAGNEAAVVDLLNLVRAGITVRRADITPREILEQIDNRDVPTGAGNLAWFQGLMNQSLVSLKDEAGNDTRVAGNLGRILTNTNGSLTRLQAIGTRQGSRAEQLFGSGVTITNGDIARALRPEVEG